MERKDLDPTGHTDEFALLESVIATSILRNFGCFTEPFAKLNVC